MKAIISKSVIQSYSTKENIFDIVLESVQKWYDRPANTLTELKKKESKQNKGFFFEELCKLYLETRNDKVWLLHEIPPEILTKLSLKKRDYGIDIICENNGKYLAVQCKYRKRGRSSKNVITWNMLSTFYALCLKTGPYDKYIVMTNADYVTHMGPKTPKDLSICIGTWRKISVETWLKMGGNEGESTENTTTEDIANKEKTIEQITIEQLRTLRLKKLEIA